jgi:hypothetical protein
VDKTYNRRWWTRTLILDGALMLVAFVVFQLIPIKRTNPPVVQEPIWNAPETRALAEKACFDCHSYETKWPWYSRVAPVSWVIWYDVTEGRQRLNFSDWAKHAGEDYVDPNNPFPPKTLSERIAQVISSGRMPPGTYRLMNPGARLSESQKAALIDGLVQTVKANAPPPPDGQ